MNPTDLLFYLLSLGFMSFPIIVTVLIALLLDYFHDYNLQKKGRKHEKKAK